MFDNFSKKKGFYQVSNISRAEFVSHKFLFLNGRNVSNCQFSGKSKSSNKL